MHRIGIHDPRHRLLIGIHIRSWHILLRAYEVEEFGGVAACHPLEFTEGHLLWIADDATFGPAKWNVDDGALPGHPRRQRAHFVDGHVWRIPDSALGKSARKIVLDPIALEDLHATRIHSRRDIDLQFSIGDPKYGVEVRIKFQQLCCSIETRHHRLERIRFFYFFYVVYVRRTIYALHHLSVFPEVSIIAPELHTSSDLEASKRGR